MMIQCLNAVRIKQTLSKFLLNNFMSKFCMDCNYMMVILVIK